MLTPFRRALLLMALVVVLGVLYLWLKLTGRNEVDVLPWLAIAVPQLISMLRTEKIDTRAERIEHQVNGNLSRARTTADVALGQLPPKQAEQVLRVVDDRLADSGSIGGRSPDRE